MINSGINSIIRILDEKYFEMAYRYAGYSEAEKLSKQYRKSLANEAQELSAEYGDEKAVEIMAERYDVNLPKESAKSVDIESYIPGPKCWAKYFVECFNKIYKLAEDFWHGDKKGNNRTIQMKKAINHAVEFMNVSMRNYKVNRHGKYVSEDAVKYMADFCNNIINRYGYMINA